MTWRTGKKSWRLSQSNKFLVLILCLVLNLQNLNVNWIIWTNQTLYFLASCQYFPSGWRGFGVIGTYHASLCCRKDSWSGIKKALGRQDEKSFSSSFWLSSYLDLDGWIYRSSGAGIHLVLLLQSNYHTFFPSSLSLCKFAILLYNRGSIWISYQPSRASKLINRNLLWIEVIGVVM